MSIDVRNLVKKYDEDIIFDGFDISFNEKYVNCIIGKSGCGKTTLLNIIAGLIPIDGGEISGISNGEISYVFQEDRLINWLTIKENLSLALKKYYSRDLLEAKINEILKLVGIEEIKDKYPDELSGGMKQRVNIARAFGKPSKIILMDEPFKSLDYKLKYLIIDEFKNILKREKRMVVLVTHDLDEAIYFDGNIIVLGEKPVKVMGIFNRQLKEQKDKILNLI